MPYIKNKIVVFVLGIIFLGFMPSQVVLATPAVGAEAAALIDISSGRILFGKNLDQKLPMASTTKIMTAILAIESGRLDETVKISSAAVNVEPSCIWLVAGEQILLRHLVYGLMLRSGNDAALAIAEHLAGDIESFCGLMNLKASELGLQNTQFKNPHGLPHGEHFTTAADLARLSAYALRNPVFLSTVSTRRFSLPGRTWHNKNELLQTYPGATGVKTGWTRAAGRCLVASAHKQGQGLAAVVLNSPSDFQEVAAMLDYGFLNYRPVTVVARGQYIQSTSLQNGKPIELVAGDGFEWPVGRGEEAHLQFAIDIAQPETKIQMGKVAGILRIQYQNRTYANIPLLVRRARGAAGSRRWADFFNNFGQLLLRERRGIQ